MNTITEVLATEAALRVAVNLALGATAASLIGLLTARAARQHAALRVGLLSATLSVLLLLPFLVAAPWSGGLIRVGSSTENISEGVSDGAERVPQKARAAQTAVGLPLPPAPPTTVSPPAPPLATGTTLPTKTPSPLLREVMWAGLLVWVLGSVACIVLTLRGLLALRRLRAGLRDTDVEWEILAQRAASAVGLDSTVRVAFAEQAVVPFTIGGKSPMIALPATLRDAEAREAEAILLHEAGHLAHRHHRLGALMVVAEILYWWIPPVRLATAALADAMEEVCDNHVVRVQGSGQALGRCLVRAAEAATRQRMDMLPGTAMLRGERGLSRRLANVLEEKMDRETRISGSERFVAVGVALACLGVAACCRMVPAAAQKPAESWTAYFPLAVGTEWQYHAVFEGQEKPSDYSMKVRRRVPLKDGGACAELVSLIEGRPGGYYYFGLRKDGYYSYHNTYTNLPGVEESDPMPQALFPPKKGKTWTWHEAYRGQISVPEGEEAPDTSQWGSDCAATLEALDAPITVPAGKYKAMRIRVVCKNEHSGDWEETRWYAKGVGLVRQEGQTFHPGGGKYVIELTAFKPGNPKAVTPEDILPLVRQNIPANLAPQTLREVVLPGGTFKTRFAVAGWGEVKKTVYRVSGLTVSVFDPTQPADWNRLFAEDEAGKPGFGVRFPFTVAQDMGRLIAEGLRWETDARTEVHSITTKQMPDGGTHIRFSVRGSWWGIEVEMQSTKQGEITKLQLRPWRS